MSSKAKQLARGSALGGISFVLRMFISLFMTPFMITSFGDHTYGLWVLVMSFSGFYGVLDLGLSTAVQRYMARAVGTGDTEEANSIFNTSLLVFSGLGILAVILAGVLAWLAPFFVTAPDVSVFRVVLICCSVNIVLAFPMRSFWGILSSNLRYDISVYLDLANVLVKTALVIIFLKCGFGVVAVAVIHLVTDLLWNASNVFYALKVAPYIRISFSRFEWPRIRMFLGYSIYVLVSRIADLMKNNIDHYVISAFVGLSAVTLYTVGTRLIGYAVELLSKLVGLMTPVFSQYEGQGNFDAIRAAFFFTFKAGIYISLFLGALLGVLGQPFIERWIGAGYEESYIILLIFLVPTVFGMIMSVSSQLFYGISKHKFLTWVNSGEAVVNLALSLILVRFWGIRGVALGTAIPACIVRIVIQPFYTARVLKVSVVWFYGYMFTAIAKAVVVLFILYILTRGLIAPSFVTLVAFGAIQAVCYGISMFYFGMSAPERERLVEVFVPSRVQGYFKNKKSV